MIRTVPLTWGAVGIPSPPAPDRPKPEQEPGKPKKLSASEVDTYKECARKWGWKYLDKVAPVEGWKASGRLLGNRVHKILEDWLISGTPPLGLEVMSLPTKKGTIKDYFPGQIAQAGLHLLPPPGVAQTEKYFKLGTLETVWHGYIDCQYILASGETVICGMFPPDPIISSIPEHYPVVLDHKTTSDFKWVKNAQILSSDTQAILYGAVALAVHRTPKVQLRWIYYHTTKHEARSVEIWLDEEHIARYLEGLDNIAREVHQLYQIRPKVLELRPNPEACERYGGCDFLPMCTDLGVNERVVSIMAKETIEALMARMGGAANGQMIPPPPMLPQAPQEEPMPRESDQGYWKPGDPMNTAQSYLLSQGKPLSIVALAADVSPPHHICATFDSLPIPQGQAPAVVPPTLPPPPVEREHINPPEAPAVAAAQPSEMPPFVPPPMSPQMQATVQATQTPAVPPPGHIPVPPGWNESNMAQQIVAQTNWQGLGGDDLLHMTRDQLKAMAIAMGIADKGTRLREDGLRDLIRSARNGTVPKSKAAAETVPHPKPGEVPWFSETLDRSHQMVPQAPVQATAVPKGFTLYINCAPQGGGYFTLEEILAQVLPKMRQDTNLPDWRLEEFGKGPGRLSSYVCALVSSLPIEGIVLSDRSPEGSACVGSLAAMAGSVVRGF